MFRSFKGVAHFGLAAVTGASVFPLWYGLHCVAKFMVSVEVDFYSELVRRGHTQYVNSVLYATMLIVFLRLWAIFVAVLLFFWSYLLLRHISKEKVNT